jgi:apoptosis-inducing factor 3
VKVSEAILSEPSEHDLEAGIDIASIPENGLMTGCFRGQPVIVTRHQGRYCVLSAKCTHMDGPLGEGILVNGEVHCPWHHARFSVLTGEAVGAPAFDPIERFPTEIREGRLFATRVVILGTGAAGYACAEFLSRRRFAGSVTVISDELDPPYDRTFCSKQYLIGMKSRQETLIATPDTQRSDTQRGPTYRLGCKVRGLNVAQKFLHLDNGERVDFDVLVLATGAEPKRADWPGSDRPNVHLLRSLRDADAIIQSAGRARDVAIIGSSFIGLEAAASLQQRKLKVRVVTPEDVPLKKLVGSDIGKMIQQVHEEKGVLFHFGRRAKSYDGQELTLDDDSIIPADFVVLGLGVTPRAELAKAAGIECAPADQGGGIVVNERLETSVKGIFAAGDVARYPDPHSARNIRVEHWVHAQRQGQHVARIIMGQVGAYSDIPFFWSAHFDTGLRYVGHVDSITDAHTDGSVDGRNFSRLLSGADKQRAYITCNRDTDSLCKEAEWDTRG